MTYHKPMRAKSYMTTETFHSETEREERIVELIANTDYDIQFKKKIAYDDQDAFILEYSVLENVS